jgi:hypothetical protein
MGTTRIFSKVKQIGWGGGGILFTYKLTFKLFTTIFIDHPGVLTIEQVLKKITLILLFAIIIFFLLILNIFKNLEWSRCLACSPN